MISAPMTQVDGKLAVVTRDAQSAEMRLRTLPAAAVFGEIAWYGPGDMNALNADMCDKGIAGVYFDDESCMIEAVLEGFDATQALNPAAVILVGDAAVDGQTLLRHAGAAVGRWERARRNRQTVAALVLSLIFAGAVAVWVAAS